MLAAARNLGEREDGMGDLFNRLRAREKVRYGLQVVTIASPCSEYSTCPMLQLHRVQYLHLCSEEIMPGFMS